MHRLLLTLAVCSALFGQVKVAQSGSDKITVDIDGKPFTEFWIAGPSVNKPYLAPLRTASGVIVTRSFPMDPSVPGEAHDHPHHRGLWFTHGDVNGYDFWGNEDSQQGANKGKGKVVLVKVNKLSSGKSSGAIDASFDWVAGGQTLLRETRRMTFYAEPDQRVIDFDINLSPDQKVTFGDTKEGMFAIRLAAPLEEEQPKGIAEPKRTGKLVNAQGKAGEKNVWGKRSEWADYSGTIDGKPVGIAIFDHPSNPRHPTYWHARGYGLFATNIFGLHDFENDKSRDGSLTIQPGQPLRFRFRVVIHPGDATSAGIRDQFAKYAAIK